MDDIQDCIEFVEGQYTTYGTDLTIKIYPTWDKILQNEKIALWAASEEDTILNLALPSAKAFLLKLAEQGIGHTSEYKFVNFVLLRGRKSQAFRVFSLLIAKQRKFLHYRGWLRGSCLGSSQLEGSQPEQIILECACNRKNILTSIKMYHGAALNGLEFCYEDPTSLLFGRSSVNFAGDEFVLGLLPSYRTKTYSYAGFSTLKSTYLDSHRGEILMGFNVKAGAWIDGIEILTSFGRKSGVTACML
jgi:hypothetical protein